MVDAPRDDVRFVVPAYGVEVDLDALPALEVVQLLSAGAEWMVDRVPEGVTLCNARGARDRAMAEWVIAALLADLKQVRPFAEAQAARRWKRLDIYYLSDFKVAVLGHGASGESWRGCWRPSARGPRDRAARPARRASSWRTTPGGPGLGDGSSTCCRSPQTTALVDAPFSRSSRRHVLRQPRARPDDRHLRLDRGAAPRPPARRPGRRRPRAAPARPPVVGGSGPDAQPARRRRHARHPTAPPGGWSPTSSRGSPAARRSSTSWGGGGDRR